MYDDDDHYGTDISDEVFGVFGVLFAGMLIVAMIIWSMAQ